MIASPFHSHSPEWTIRPLRPFEPQLLFPRSNPTAVFNIRLSPGAFGSWGIPIECLIYDYCDRYANLPSSSISSLINSEISRLRGFRLAAKRICGGGAPIHHSHRSPRLFFSGGLPKTWGLLCCTNLSCQGWPWGKLRHTLRNVLEYPASTAPPWFFRPQHISPTCRTIRLSLRRGHQGRATKVRCPVYRLLNGGRYWILMSLRQIMSSLTSTTGISD